MNMMITPIRTPKFTAQRPLPATLPQTRPIIAPTLRFSACVNRETSTAQFQDILMNGDLRTRLHYIASASGKETSSELLDVLIKLLLGQPMDANGTKAIYETQAQGYKTQKLSILAVSQWATEKDPSKKQTVLQALRDARRAPHMRTARGDDGSRILLALLDEAIQKLEHPGAANSAVWAAAMHDYQHAQNPANHHH